MLKEHITSGLYIAPGNRTHAADEKDYDSWTTEAVAEELAPLGTTTLERSRRHGLSNVVISLHALPPKQHLAHLATVRNYIGAANHDRLEQDISPNASRDLETDYLAKHPLPDAALAALTAANRRHRPLN